LIHGPGQTYVKVEMVALFCNPVSGGTFSNKAIEIIKWVKKLALAQAKVFPHLEDWVRIGHGMPHVKGHNSVQQLRYSKE
jgi:hypothetical protein